MKTLLKISMLASVLAFVIGCGGKALTPEETVTKFLQALEKKDFEGAKAYADKETKTVLTTLAGMPKKDEKPSGATVKSVKCTLSGDAGTCETCCNAAGANSSVAIVKEGGKWAVSMTKEQMTKKETPKLDSMVPDINLSTPDTDTTATETTTTEGGH